MATKRSRRLGVTNIKEVTGDFRMTDHEKVLKVAEDQRDRLSNIASGYDAVYKAAKTSEDQEAVNIEFGTMNVELQELDFLIKQTKHDIADDSESETSRQSLNRLVEAIEKPTPEKPPASFTDAPTTLRRYY